MGLWHFAGVLPWRIKLTFHTEVYHQQTTEPLSTMQNSYTNRILISFMTAVSLGLACTVFAGDNYSALAAQGYRWVVIDGPYACITEQDAKRIAAHDTDASELQVVESIECYYLIPGAIVQVIKQDPAHGLSEVRLGSINRSLWTYSRFLSEHPVRDTYGVIETPESSGLIQAADTATVPASASDNPTDRSQSNENP
jgi:hypothetical protein